MRAEFSSRFLKDIANLPDLSVKSAVAEAIEAVEAAPNSQTLVHLKKLSGFKNAYRIRVGDFRIGLFITGEIAEFVRVVNRKDIYKLFP